MNNLNNHTYQDQTQGSSLISPISQLEGVSYHHQNPAYLNSVPTDPFAQAAFETSMMFVPEVATGHANSNSQEERTHQTQEMYEDIVINTLPGLTNHEFSNDLIQSNVVFNLKRNLQFAGVRSTPLPFDTAFKSESSKCESQLDLEHDKVAIDLSDDEDGIENFSDAVDDDDKNMIFDLLRLRPTTRRFLSENLEAEEDPTGFQIGNIFEDPERFDIEYEECGEGAQNRSQCCGGENDEFNNGLDSTMSFSMRDDINSIRNFSKKRRENKALSQNGENNIFSSGDKKAPYNAAISQYNFNDLDGDQEDQYLENANLEALMLAEKGDRLKINKHMSQRVSFADSDTKYRQRNQSVHFLAKQKFMGKQLLTPSASKEPGDNQKLAKFDENLDIDKEDMLSNDSHQKVMDDIQYTPTSFNNSLFQYYMNNKNSQWQQPTNQDQIMQSNNSLLSPYSSLVGNEQPFQSSQAHICWKQLGPIKLNEKFDKIDESQEFTTKMEKDTGVQIELPESKNSLISIQITDQDIKQKTKGKSPKPKNVKKTLKEQSVSTKAKSIVIKKVKAESKVTKVKPSPVTKKARVKPRKSESQVEAQNKKTEHVEAKISTCNTKSEITFQNNGLSKEVFPKEESKIELPTNVQVSKKSGKISKVGTANARAEKYYKQFDFFFNRSCFRIMTEFFKDKFNKFYADKMIALKKSNFVAWQKTMKDGGLTATSKCDMNIMMRDFIDYILGKEVLKECGGLDENQRQQVIHSMMMICFSHRYNKGDRFIQEAEAEAKQNKEANSIEFSIIRDVMYKYSKKAQDRYFQFPIEAFLFAAFALSDEGLNFLQNKPDNQSDPEKLRRLKSDLSELKNQAVESLYLQSKLHDQLYSANPTTQGQCQQLNSQTFQSEPRQTDQSPATGVYLLNELKRMTRGRM